MNEIQKDYIEHQERKLAVMKERVLLLSKAIPELQAALEADRKRWEIKKEVLNESSKDL